MKSSTQRTGTKTKLGSQKSQTTLRKSSGASDTDERAWKTTQLSRNVFELRIPYRRAKDWEFWFHISSDHHLDSKKCDRKLLKSHLDDVVARNAAAFFNGDQADAMQGKFDKRSSKSELRAEYLFSNYYDALVDHAVNFYEPYAKNIVVIAEGNHETSIRNHCEIDICQRLVALLNSKTGGQVHCGGYSGWIRFAFTEKRKERTDPVIQTVTMHYDHGWGGGGQVTHDAIQHQRRSVYLPDADIVVSGHSHDFWSKKIARLRLTKNGSIYNDSVLHLKCPSFKNDYGDGHGGFAVERGHAPKVLGSWFMRFFWSGRHDRILYEAIPAE